MKKIVVGFDGSDTAARAADEAAGLAQATGAELHVVSVVDDERYRQGVSTAEAHQHAEQRAAAMIQQLLAPEEGQLADRVAGITTFGKVVSGSAASRIVDYAQAIEADLIVVGNRRVQGIERVLGSVAIAILRQAPCSVYVAHTA
ncbi:MAG: universal stress protein [Acidimicrobiales bacterium]